VNLLPASNLMFYLYYFLKLEVRSHLTWPTKYELFATTVRKLLTSVPFRSDPVFTRKTLQRPTPSPTKYEPPATTRWKSVIRRTPFQNFGPTPSATCWGRVPYARQPNINFLRPAVPKFLTMHAFRYLSVGPDVYSRGLSQLHSPAKYESGIM
jgi:hypothetical protein